MVFNTAFANPLTLTVTSSYDEPVDGDVVSFIPPISGPSVVISGSPVTITGGLVYVSVTANGLIGGPYSVTASSAGATSVNFSQTNAFQAIFLPLIFR